MCVCVDEQLGREWVGRRGRGSKYSKFMKKIY